MRDALLVLGMENAAMVIKIFITTNILKLQFFHKFEEDLIKVSMGRKVEVNQYFCSTLVAKPKIKTNTINMVPELHNKVHMVQAFINRLRNRATKVNLLSSGPGYIIAANDLDECLAKLTKHIFDRSLMENFNREESHNMIKAQYNSQLEIKTYEIQILESKIQYFKENIEKLSDIMLYQKGNSLIFEMDAILRDLFQAKSLMSKMEEKIKEKVVVQFQQNLDRLKLEILIREQKFKDFKLEVSSYVKNELKAGSLNISKTMSKRIANAIDISENDAGKTVNEQDDLKKLVKVFILVIII